MKRLLAVMFATILLAGSTGCESLDRMLCRRPNPCAPEPCAPAPCSPCESMPYGGGMYDSGPYIQGQGETIVPGPAF